MVGTFLARDSDVIPTSTNIGRYNELRRCVCTFSGFLQCGKGRMKSLEISSAVAKVGRSQPNPDVSLASAQSIARRLLLRQR